MVKEKYFHRDKVKLTLLKLKIKLIVSLINKYNNKITKF